MTDETVKLLTASEFRKYRESHEEDQYELVDVRHPEEYLDEHIPGSKLIPLPELESRIFELPPDRELVFYCRSGVRSMAAASLALEAEVTQKPIYNLTGGILAWQDRVLTDLPKLEALDPKAPLASLLYTAMDLEKGAWRFYEHLRIAHAGEPFAKTFEELSKAETGHAHMVYQYWKKTQEDPPPFESLYFELPGEILEGGEPLRDLLSRLDAGGPEEASGSKTLICVRLMEISMMIELAAYDLYRIMADVSTASEGREIFLSIAQAEKGHIRVLTRALGECP